MSKIYIGIDPGLDGAVSFIEGDTLITADAPTITTVVKRKTRRTFDLGKMWKMLSGPEVPGLQVEAMIEKVGAMPKQGISSAFNFGEGVGYWKMALTGHGIPFTEVPPQEWKGSVLRGMSKGPGDKGPSVLRAQQLFPRHAGQFTKPWRGREVLLDGRAEAALIAWYLRSLREGGAAPAPAAPAAEVTP